MTSPLRRSRRWFLAVAGTLSGIGVAGCTGDDDGDTPTTTAEETPSPTPSPTPAEIQYETLEVGSDELFVDETTVIEVTVVNTGGEATTDTVELLLEGEVYDSSEVEVAPDESETVEFVVEVEEPGEHDIQVGDLTALLTVNQLPPEIEFTDLSIGPDTPVSQEPFTVTVTLENVGGETGHENVQLYVESEIHDEIDVELQPEEAKEVEFEIEFDEPGTYEISSGGLNEIVEVLTPAEFDITDLEFDPTEPRPGDTISVSVTVENIGGVEESKTIQFNVNGETFPEDVTLGGGEREGVSTTVRINRVGTYEIEVADLTANIDVGYDWNEIGETYEGPDGLDVTLESFDVIEREGSFRYEITYVLENNTDSAIDEGSFKLYGDAPLSQSGFFGRLFPGDSMERSHTFEEEKDFEFDTLAYHHDQFFALLPPEDSLVWPVEY